VAAGTGGTLNQQARDLIALASRQFDDAQAALQAGDVAGDSLKTEALQQTLRDLQAQRQRAAAGNGRRLDGCSSPRAFVTVVLVRQ